MPDNEPTIEDLPRLIYSRRVRLLNELEEMTLDRRVPKDMRLTCSAAIMLIKYLIERADG